MAVFTNKLEDLQSSHDISRVDEKVRIPEVGTYVLGRNLIGAREDKYFDVNGKPISLEEFENKLVSYEDKLDEQSKVDPQKASTIPDASSTANPPQSNSAELPPSIITPTKRQEPPVNQYPSYNRPNRVNNTIITNNQLPQNHKSTPNFMSSGGSKGGDNVTNSMDIVTISQSILLTQLSGS